MRWRSVTQIVACNSVAILIAATVFGVLYLFNQRWIGFQWMAMSAGGVVGQLSVLTFVIVIPEPHHPKRWLLVSGLALFAALCALAVSLANTPLNLNTLTRLEDIGWYVLFFSDTFVCVFATVVAYFLSTMVLWWPAKYFLNYKFYLLRSEERLPTSRLTVSGILFWTTAIAGLVALTSNEPNIAYAMGALLGIQTLALPTIMAACWAAFHTGHYRWAPLCLACVAVLALETLVLSFFVIQLLGFMWLALLFNVVLAFAVFANILALKNAGMHIARDHQLPQVAQCSPTY